jgi:S1-C subfamily serine protease
MTMPTIHSRLRIMSAALAVGATLVLTPLASAQERQVPPSREALQYSYSPIVKMAAPAVVNVYVRSRVRTSVSPFANDPFFQRFFGGRGGFGLPQERIQSSLARGSSSVPMA